MSDIIKNLSDKKLLTIKDCCEYLSVGESTVRKLLTEPTCSFSLKIGNKWYANRTFLDKWIDEKTTTNKDILL